MSTRLKGYRLCTNLRRDLLCEQIIAQQQPRRSARGIDIIKEQRTFDGRKPPDDWWRISNRRRRERLRILRQPIPVALDDRARCRLVLGRIFHNDDASIAHRHCPGAFPAECKRCDPCVIDVRRRLTDANRPQIERTTPSSCNRRIKIDPRGTRCRPRPLLIQENIFWAILAQPVRRSTRTASRRAVCRL